MCYIPKDEYIATHYNSYELVSFLTDEQIDNILMSCASGQSVYDEMEQAIADYPDYLYCKTDLFAPSGIEEAIEPYSLISKAKMSGINIPKTKQELFEEFFKYVFVCGTEYALECVSGFANEYAEYKF